jgi:hypothetical protein
VTIDLTPNALPCLEMMELDQVIWLDLVDTEVFDSDELRSFFSPTHLPALNHLVLGSRAVDYDRRLYDTLLPQLTHLHYEFATIESILPKLQLCTALKSFWITCCFFTVEDLSLDFIDICNALNLEEFRFRCSNDIDMDSGWRKALPAIQKLVELLEDMKSLKKLSLVMNEVSLYEERTNEWKNFKEDGRKICVKRNIEIVRYDDFFLDFERDDVAWID